MLRQSFIRVRIISLLAICVVIGCEEGPPPKSVNVSTPAPTPTEPEVVTTEVVTLALEDIADSTQYVRAERGAEAMRRLTRQQFVQAVKGLLGDDIVSPAVAEPDVARGGLKAIGASFLTYSARGVESIESAAYELAKQALDTKERRAALVPCSPSGVTDVACTSKALQAIARRAWRRPVTQDDVSQLVDVAVRAGKVLDDFYSGLEYGIAGILQSPYFLFRIELGPEQATSNTRSLTDHELAARLSFFLWNMPPDDELSTAADQGKLSTDEGLFAQANRLLNDPRARAGIRALFDDYLKLYELDHLTKDPTVFEHFNDQLGHFAREETLRLIEDLAFDHPRDFRKLLTTRVTFLNPMLASIYRVPNPKGENFTRVELPEVANRVGMLGHVSFLGVHSHSRASSATRRGVAVRTILLCQSIPAAPVDVDTSIPEPSGEIQTLRERVAEHLENPACAGCHQLTDPIGLGLENYDGIGRYRSTEYGDVIDPAGTLDGREFKDAIELAHAIRDHEEFVPCIVKVLSRYAIGRLESDGEADWLEVLNDRFKLHGYQLRPLILELIMSPIFRGVGQLKEDRE